MGSVVGPVVEAVVAAAYSIPTDQPEADGTIAWDHTTMVVVTASSEGYVGTGWTFAPAAAARVVEELLAPVVTGRSALAPREAQGEMVRSVRNAGRGGIAGMAISAVDVALWDLGARILGMPLTRWLGGSARAVPVARALPRRVPPVLMVSAPFVPKPLPTVTSEEESIRSRPSTWRLVKAL